MDLIASCFYCFYAWPYTVANCIRLHSCRAVCCLSNSLLSLTCCHWGNNLHYEKQKINTNIYLRLFTLNLLIAGKLFSLCLFIVLLYGTVWYSDNWLTLAYAIRLGCYLAKWSRSRSNVCLMHLLFYTISYLHIDVCVSKPSQPSFPLESNGPSLNSIIKTTTQQYLFYLHFYSGTVFVRSASMTVAWQYTGNTVT